MTIEAHGKDEIWVRCGGGDGSVVSVHTQEGWSEAVEVIISAYAGDSEENDPEVQIVIGALEALAFAKMLEAMANDALTKKGIAKS